MQTSSPLRVAIVGTGYFSHYHCHAWQRINNTQLMGVHSLDKLQAQQLASRYNIAHVYDSLPALLESGNVDLIDIVTPPAAHAQILKACANKGINAVCQKPFCADLKEATDTVDYCKAKGITVVVHENFRFQPWYRCIHKILQSNQLGALYEISFNLRPGDGQGDDAYLSRQPYFQTQEKFLIQETGIHFVDVFRFLMGDISGLFARLIRLNPAIVGEDAGVVMLEFKSGARGVLNANRLSDHEAIDCRLTMGDMRIEGEKACLYLNGNGVITLRKHGSQTSSNIAYDWQAIDFGGDCVKNCNEHIARHFLYGEPLENSAADYLINRRIESAIYASSAGGNWVDLPDY